MRNLNALMEFKQSMISAVLDRRMAPLYGQTVKGLLDENDDDAG